MKVKEDSEKSGLKLNLHTPKIIASGPITSWQIDVAKVETVTKFSFLGFQKSLQMLTAAMKLKVACLLPVRITTTNLDSVFKSRDVTLSIKDCIVKDTVFQ